MAGFLLTVALQSWVRAVICGAFLARIFLIAGRSRTVAVVSNIVFTGIVTLFLLIEVVSSFFPPPVGASCKPEAGKNGWHWASLVWLDVAQSAMMMALAIAAHFLQKRRARQESTSVVRDMVVEFTTDMEEKFELQIYVITIFYLISCLFDVVYIATAAEEIKVSALECVENKYLLSKNADGSVALTLYTFVCYFYALVMLYVFYYIPKKSGLVLDALSGDQKLSIYMGDDGMNKSLLYMESHQRQLKLS